MEREHLERYFTYAIGIDAEVAVVNRLVDIDAKCTVKSNPGMMSIGDDYDPGWCFG